MDPFLNNDSVIKNVDLFTNPFNLLFFFNFLVSPGNTEYCCLGSVVCIFVLLYFDVYNLIEKKEEKKKRKTNVNWLERKSVKLRKERESFINPNSE